jgi:C-methyltransferase
LPITAKVPPARLARAVETARHYLLRLHQKLAPPQAAMMEMILAGWMSQAITAAADLGLADALANGPLAIDDLARKVDADAETLARLLRALIAHGVFRQRRDGRYELNPLADTLRSGAPASLAGAARFYGSRLHREHWSMLTSSVRTGQPGVPALRGMDWWAYAAATPEFGDLFNEAMTSITDLAAPPVVASYDFTPFRTIVDVGGGHGRLLAAILAATPTSRGVLFDLPEVVAGAPALLRERGVADRVEVVGGSFFEAVPSGDAYVLKHVIHDWSNDEAVQILRNVRSAAGSSGVVLLVEMVIPRHHREFLGKLLDLEMLNGGPARERTADEYRRLLARAGLRMTRVVPTAGPYSLVEARAG